MRIAFRDVALDAMIEERDHLRTRILLIEDPGIETVGSATATRAALAELEERIRLHGNAPRLSRTAASPPETEGQR